VAPDSRDPIDRLNDEISEIRSDINSTAVKLAEVKSSVTTFHWGAGIIILGMGSAFGWYCSVVNRQEGTINVNTDRILELKRESGESSSKFEAFSERLTEVERNLNRRIDELKNQSGSTK